MFAVRVVSTLQNNGGESHSLALLLSVAAESQQSRLGEWDFSDLEMRDVINAGALDLIEQTVTAGASAQSARKWWMGELARTAREQESELESLAVTPAQIAQLQTLIDEKKINDKIARQVLGKVLAGEGDPGEIVEKEGLAVVSDESVLTAAVAFWGIAVPQFWFDEAATISATHSSG